MAIRNATNYDDDRLFEGDSSESGDGSIVDQLDIQHYVRILRKRKWPIALFTAGVVALAAYYAYTATPVYSSTSTLLIESQDQNLVQFDELVGLDTENQDYYETQFELLRSRGLALRVVEHMNLWDNPELSPEHRAAEPNSGAADSAIGKLTGLLGLGSAETSADAGLPDASAEAALDGNIAETTTATTTIDLSDTQFA